MKINTKGSIYVKFLIMTIVPMFLMGIIITSSASTTFTKAMHKEVKVELSNLANAVVDSYDLLYPGDYKMVGAKNVAIVKGDKVISTTTELIDKIKAKSGVEISVFYMNTRIATTIEDERYNHLVNTVANAKVVNEVIENKSGRFYNNAKIDGVAYYAYYVPLFNSDGSCVGMIGVAKSAKNIQKSIDGALISIILVAVVAMVVAAGFVSIYSKDILATLEAIRKYLNKVSTGKLNEELDQKITDRTDEIGDIGKAISGMRNSLQEMVEMDALTRVNNRRSGEEKLRSTYEESKRNGMPFSICIGDIDFFKKVNDTYGHECGDEVLKEVAYNIKKAMLGAGYLSRWGGEEFLLIFDRVDFDKACEVLSELLNNIRDIEINYKGITVKVTMTFGIVEGNTKEDLHTQIKKADDKLYEGKISGRNKIIKD